MPSLASWLAPARRSLGDHLGRLRRSFDALAEQVRGAIARAVGRSVAEAVTEAVDAALAPAQGRLDSFPPTRDAYPTSRRSPLWGDASESRWDRQQEEYDPHRGSYSDDYDDRDHYADDPGDEAAETPPPRRRCLGRALAAALQAAGWWLNRHPGRLSVLAAVGLGLVAGTAALLRDTAAGPAGLVGAALSLLALDGLVRSGSDLAAQSAPP
jgi:hypothetical protein